MAYGKKLLLCVCVQFLLIWTFWNSDLGVKDPRKASTGPTKMYQSDIWPRETEMPLYKETNCSRKDNVVFLKPYYSGGSTMENILNRIALKMNKNVVSHPNCVQLLSEDSEKCELPKLSIFSQPEYFKGAEMAMGHLKFSPDAIRHIFPADTVFITMLRHPFEQIQYALHNQGIQTSTEKSANLLNRSGITPYAKLFGIPYSIRTNPDAIKEYLRLQHNNFTLVVIAEHFEESLLLLKRKLCWSLEDLLFVNTQNLPYSAKIQQDINLIQKHKQANLADYVIYDYFKERLLESLSKEDSSFNEEFFHFKKVNKIANDFCSKFYLSIRDGSSNVQYNVQTISISRWNKAFNINATTCATMKVNNNIYKDIFLMKRYPHFCHDTKLFTQMQNLSDLCSVNKNTITVPKQILFDPKAYLIQR